MDQEWLSAAAARELITPLSPFNAPKLICSRAFDGLIEARAHRLILGDKILDDATVPAGFWWARGDLALEQNWATGDFSTWLDGKHHLRAYGVEFRRSDVEAMLPRPAQPSFKTAPPGSYAASGRCLTELTNALNCEEAEAERLLLQHCQMGAVPGRSANMTITTNYRYGVDTEEYEGAEIPAIFWEKCAVPSSAILDWMTGRFIGKAYVDGDDVHYRLDGVEFDVSAVVDLERFARRERERRLLPKPETVTMQPTASKADLAEPAMQPAPTPEPESPPLPAARLQHWWTNKAAVRESLSLEELLVLARHAHPTHSISRERIRNLGGGRKRGPKPIGEKKTAE